MRTARILLTLAALSLIPASSHAITLNFELSDPEGTVLSSQYAGAGVAISGGLLVYPGLPSFGFDGNSSGIGCGSDDIAVDVCAGTSSGKTCTSVSQSTGPIVIGFAHEVCQVGVDLCDIEGYGPGDGEAVTIDVFDVLTGGSPIYTTTYSNVGQPLGTDDGLLHHVNLYPFTGDSTIRRIELHRAFGGWGWAIDNLSFDCLPVPVQPTTWGGIKSRFDN